MTVCRALRRAGGLAVCLVLAACGSGSSVVVRPPTAPLTSSSAVRSSSAPPDTRHPAITVTPARDLRDGQRVRVTGTGFSPGEALNVIECAQKGTQTGPGDCNLASMLGVTSDADGRVDTTLAVARGPFGANGIVCGVRQACLISVTQASLDPTEEADAAITFAKS